MEFEALAGTTNPAWCAEEDRETVLLANKEAGAKNKRGNVGGILRKRMSNGEWR